MRNYARRKTISPRGPGTAVMKWDST